ASGRHVTALWMTFGDEQISAIPAMPEGIRWNRRVADNERSYFAVPDGLAAQLPPRTRTELTESVGWDIEPAAFAVAPAPEALPIVLVPDVPVAVPAFEPDVPAG